jgi:SAM-dependent methyltransferase
VTDGVARWDGAEAYERYMGRWSRLVAPRFLAWLDAGPGLRWLDVGCGTGALTSCVLASHEPTEVLGFDPSSAFVERARTSVPDERARFALGSAEDLAVAAGQVDVVVSALVLNFVPDPVRALGEMVRVTRPGGTVGCYVWDYLGEMQMLRHFWDALLAVSPDTSGLDEVRRFALCRPEPLTTELRAAGLETIEVEPIDIETKFRDFDDYWSPFEAGKGAAPAHLMSLPEPDRAAVEQRVRDALPFNTDGSIELVARAWAARGQIPS